MSASLPSCILCSRPLTSFGELQDFVCAGRVGESVDLSCTVRLKKWMESGEFKGALDKDRLEDDKPDWQLHPWRVAIDHWLERGGLPKISYRVEERNNEQAREGHSSPSKDGTVQQDVAQQADR